MSVYILDGQDVPHPEDMAMIQALYSRSPESVLTHLDRVKRVGSGNFMDQYYIGYGHDSIGDLGTIVIFFENISMAASKAIQNHPLYRGQECSTRYLNFANQPFFSPLDDDRHYSVEARNILEGWRALYLEALTPVESSVRSVYAPSFILPKDTPVEQKEKLYNKTIKAITFDVCRGLLPVAAMTNVAWATELRTAASHLRSLMLHPLKEVRDLATDAYDALHIKYPNSFHKSIELTEIMSIAGLELPGPYFRPETSVFQHLSTAVDLESDLPGEIYTWSEKTFDRKVVPFWPEHMKHTLRFNLEGSLDYASYRDLQRHRNGFMSLSAMTKPTPYHDWYLRTLYQIGDGFKDRLHAQRDAVAKFLESADDLLGEYEAQYFLPMMSLVPVNVKCHLGQVIYLCNLRSSVSVHPTLRELIQDWAWRVEDLVGRKIFRLDSRDHYQATSRGNQDITQK